ncbi:MAG: signal recognition particle protein [Candidatus Eisenbacteria bacterium]|uniref:Signal recognition particle protein n=1 Tax=Eiseniibacteriota bacterium TaxID=2212470 RepID=A0A9D6QMY4_UNCEI|nr:signal recognition particle protein [Candidatus Eisenbacteria bacterium]MBI3540233.1 signal recognition particle protein [Candidatus Eisenbacteria bacterium]
MEPVFEALTDRLQGVFKRLTGQGRLTPDNIREGLREVRRALLEADVQVAVARDFVARVEARAVGEDVLKSLTPGQQVVGIVRDELESLLGKTPVALAGSPHLPTVVLLAGLQGSGKTTFAGKLALWLKQREKRALLASADVYRPAAIDQLERVAGQAGAGFWRAPDGTPPREIATLALGEARRRGFDFLVLDTAGRLHIDAELMAELQDLKRASRAHQVLLVVDGMTGQEAVRIGETFATQVGVDGLVLTKMDGDARGGAALSLRQVTGKPILFLGVGEKLDGLEVFQPDRLAGRILGMGDVVGLVERARAAVDEKEAERLSERMRRAEFTLEDFLEQLRQMKKMGPLEDLMKMVPGMPRGALAQAKPDNDRLTKYEAILLSMTVKERRLPRVIDGSRRRRIAAGSGTTVTEVNRLLKDFDQARALMKRLRHGPRGLAGLRGRR